MRETFAAGARGEGREGSIRAGVQAGRVILPMKTFRNWARKKKRKREEVEEYDDVGELRRTKSSFDIDLINKR